MTLIAAVAVGPTREGSSGQTRHLPYRVPAGSQDEPGPSSGSTTASPPSESGALNQPQLPTADTNPAAADDEEIVVLRDDNAATAIPDFFSAALKRFHAINKEHGPNEETPPLFSALEEKALNYVGKLVDDYHEDEDAIFDPILIPVAFLCYLDPIFDPGYKIKKTCFQACLVQAKLKLDEAVQAMQGVMGERCCIGDPKNWAAAINQRIKDIFHAKQKLVAAAQEVQRDIVELKKTFGEGKTFGKTKLGDAWANRGLGEP